MSQSQDNRVGTLVAETYRLERLIASGGMGDIYEASHLRINRRFAIKFLRSDHGADEDALERFKREAQIASGLGHDNIVGIVDFNVTETGDHYIVMELLEGESLADRLRERGRLTVGRSLEIAHQLARALAVAHGKGVIHRDLKPLNIFLSRKAEGEETVKILDFGICKIRNAAQQLTADMALLGTAAYMAPEQASGDTQRVDQRSDIFSLGAILYEMISGKQPFHAPSIPAVLYQVVYKEPVPLGKLVPECPNDVVHIVERAMAKRLDARFQSMNDVARELKASLKRLGGADVSKRTLRKFGSDVTTGPGSPAREAREEIPADEEGEATIKDSDAAALGVRGGAPPGTIQGTPSGPPPSGSAEPVAEPAETDSRTPSPTTSLSGAASEYLPVTPPRASRRYILVAALGAAVIVAVVLAVRFAGKDSGPGSKNSAGRATSGEHSTPEPGREPASAPVKGPSPVDTVRVTLILEPASAEVSVDGRWTKDNPLTLDRSDEKVELRVTAAGHRPEVRNLVPDRNQELKISLKKKPPSQRRAVAAKARKPAGARPRAAVRKIRPRRRVARPRKKRRRSGLELDRRYPGR